MNKVSTNQKHVSRQKIKGIAFVRTTKMIYSFYIVITLTNNEDKKEESKYFDEGQLLYC